jgi:ubiquinone/menaquinone biosynthesis C-methylase UbiE
VLIHPNEFPRTAFQRLRPQDGVRDVPAWERFCELIARGGGVCDHPGRPDEQGPPSEYFFQLEVDRVEHHRLNTVPFLIEHCGLSGRSVLEFGAGTGGLSVAMAQSGVASVDAVEPIELNFEAGRCRVRAFGLEDRVRFHHHADTAHLPFADRSVDAVVCSSVLQYVPDAGQRRALLTEMARVVRPGGLLAVCNTGNGLYPGGPHSSRWWSNLFPRRAAHRGHNRGITYWEVRRALAPLGFRVLPQRGAAIERWRRRAAARTGTGPRKLALSARLAAFRAAGGVLGPLTGAPAEAFLPYPDMAFRKDAG